MEYTGSKSLNPNIVIFVSEFREIIFIISLILFNAIAIELFI